MVEELGKLGVAAEAIEGILQALAISSVEELEALLGPGRLGGYWDFWGTVSEHSRATSPFVSVPACTVSVPVYTGVCVAADDTSSAVCARH